MAWVAFDRAVKARRGSSGSTGPVDRWRGAARRGPRARCASRASTPSATRSRSPTARRALDASLLMIPLVGFLPPDDPRVAGTVDAIERELDARRLRRCATRPRTGVDGLPPGEGVFLPCSFWLADNLALMGRIDEARALFERLVGLCNDVGLLSEEYDPASRPPARQLPAGVHPRRADQHRVQPERRDRPSPEPLGHRPPSDQPSGSTLRRPPSAPSGRAPPRSARGAPTATVRDCRRRSGCSGTRAAPPSAASIAPSPACSSNSSDRRALASRRHRQCTILAIGSSMMPGRAGVLERRDQHVDLASWRRRSRPRTPSSPNSFDTVGDFSAGSSAITASRLALVDVELQQHAAARLERAGEQRLELLHRRALRRVGVAPPGSRSARCARRGSCRGSAARRRAARGRSR